MKKKTINPKPKIGMNANEIAHALHKMFPAPDWLAIEELFIPGFDRYIDFWAMRVSTPGNMNKSWPAHFAYLRIHSIEIKVSKADFKSEMNNPNKKIGAVEFSNYYSFAAPKGIIDPDELPNGIGYIEFRGSKGKFIRTPRLTYLQTPGWDFIAAIGRGTNK